MSCAAQPQQPLVQGSGSSVGDAPCGCGRERCRDGATCKSFAPSCQAAQPKPTQAPGSPGSRHAPSAWSSLACEDGSAWQHPVPNVPQNRPCHEKGIAPRVNVIVRDGTSNNYIMQTLRGNGFDDVTAHLGTSMPSGGGYIIKAITVHNHSIGLRYR